MSNNSDQETGGASIIPSARPSIHDHGNCPFAYSEVMGRYGIKNNSAVRAGSNKHKPNQSNDGTDEVDNVLSKPVNNTTPLPLTQSNRNRRKSFDDEQHQIENDDSDEPRDDNRCEIQYSDVSYQSANEATPFANSSSTVIRRRTPVNNLSDLNRSGSVQRLYDTPNYFRQTKVSQPQRSTKMVLPLLLIVGFIVTVASMFNNTIVTRPVVYDESRFYNDIDLLGKKYHIDEDAVLQMQTGIATIVERQDTGSFMYVYNSNNDNFNAKEFNRFVIDISNTASKYLRNESTLVHYTLVEGRTLDMYGPSELINAFREDLDKTGVMLVKDVEAIQSTLAMAFHFYCDEYNPLVKKSAIFFTLDLANCSVIDKRPTHAVIEKCLAKKWNSVPADSIGPLLTRVVSVVIDLTGTF